MTRYCPKCKKEIDKKVFGLSEFCPDCGTQTIEKDSSFSLNLGDADAISGGIHNTDSHNVDSHEVHTTTHNTTNNVTNYVQQFAKNAEEAAIEKKFQFRQYCEKIVQKGGLISAEGKVLLDRKMAELGLSQDEGDAVVLSVKQSKIRSSSELNLLAKIKLDSAKLAIKQNSQNVRKSLSELKAQCLIYDNEELHFYYNLLLSALDAKQCIVRYEGRKADSYWMAFWAYLAYIKMGDCEMAEQTIAGLSTFEEMPQGNLILLDTVGRISDIIDNDDAKESQLSLLNEVSGDCSDLLTDFKRSLVDICSDKMEKPDFFAKHFSGIDFAAREEAEKKRKAEAEQKAKEEAERRAREEAERIAREVAERKTREEAERKAREEAERKAREEVERKAREEAERQRKAEAERRAKEEAERKAREEAKRIAREEAEREAREEAERLAREEAEKKREEEAERKAIEEAQRKAREEAERLAREEAEKKRKEEAERKAREKAEQKAREEYDKKQAPYSVVIDKVNDSFAAMITARSVFGWGSADFRKKTASLPFVNTPVDGKINAEKISSTLNKGGFSSHIEKAQGENGLNEETSTEPVPHTVTKPVVTMEYVDLGLSVKWAKCNLGAKAPEEVGDYFAWGELSPKPEYERGNYKFGAAGLITKYNTKDTYGKVDNLKQLELSDDAAHQTLGGDWHIPTPKEVKELKDNCSSSRTTINGVKGVKYKSRIKGYTDKWIFFPDTGYRGYDDILFSQEGYYWTSSLYTRRPDCALTIFCNSADDDRGDRTDGLAIRPVTK